MKRYFCLFFILVALVACSRKEPTPTSLPSPTPSVDPTPVPSFTPTPQGSPVPRITIVPSATRLPPTQQDVLQDSEALLTSTAETPPPPVPSSTPTRKVIDAAATATQPPTATLPESPLPTPSLVGPSPLPSPERETPPASTGEPTSPVATSNLSPSSAATTSTPTPTGSDGPTSTSTPTLSPTPQGEAWPFERVFIYHDEQAGKLYIGGQVVNNTGSSQRITTLTPVVYDGQGNPVTTAADFDYLPAGLNYSEVLGKVSLAPGQRLAVGFGVSLPEGIAFETRYRILVAAVSTEPARNDIVTTQTSHDNAGWPNFIHVNGTLVNPGPKLTEYLLIAVSVYDEDERVIGLGWSYETAPLYLTTGEHPFDVKATMFEAVGNLGLDMDGYDVQGLGK
jgi:hypothetical protein